MKYWRTPLDLDRVKVPHGTVHIISERCKGCGFCIEYCPKEILVFSKAFNRKGYHYPVLSRAEDCTGCDLCGLYCPDFAIFGVRYRDLEKRQSPAEDAATEVRP